MHHTSLLCVILVVLSTATPLSSESSAASDADSITTNLTEYNKGTTKCSMYNSDPYSCMGYDIDPDSSDECYFDCDENTCVRLFRDKCENNV